MGPGEGAGAPWTCAGRALCTAPFAEGRGVLSRQDQGLLVLRNGAARHFSRWPLTHPRRNGVPAAAPAVRSRSPAAFSIISVKNKALPVVGNSLFNVSVGHAAADKAEPGKTTAQPPAGTDCL